jgi:hypothetical protein
MTDYYPLPGDSVSIPNSSTPSTVPLDGGTASGGIVKLTAGEWEKRAQVAADGAARLQNAARAIENTGLANHFGECVEGTGMHSALNTALQRWAAQLHQQSLALKHISSASAAAAPILNSADERSAGEIST